MTLDKLFETIDEVSPGDTLVEGRNPTLDPITESGIGSNGKGAKFWGHKASKEYAMVYNKHPNKPNDHLLHRAEGYKKLGKSNAKVSKKLNDIQIEKLQKKDTTNNKPKAKDFKSLKDYKDAVQKWRDEVELLEPLNESVDYEILDYLEYSCEGIDE